MTESGTTSRAYAHDFVDTLNEVILQPTVLLLMAIAMLVFLYGGFTYVVNADNEQARSEGQKNMLYGVVGFFVMVSALAILRIFAATLGLDGVLDESMNNN